ncbi:proton-coupled amino acid transporter-like protein CG1139 isoform X2 [Belonocnema kinseyi]|uniref:proton-coupled amino acid transporter-like protein CG1139 isoform X2 n=1 Tax=Belonocnema kinseyi TaxID=2817044 RepID=UPI00143D38EC|nr:proton-coupled amino acid transporter-like protein CG1139 isoform X2 [Belonocnema kinseyi]
MFLDCIDQKKQPSSNGSSSRNGKDGVYTVELQSKKKYVEELEGTYDPYQNREVEHPTTFWETLFHLLKGSLGTGILAMPKAFAHAGFAIGVVGTAVIGFLCTYCIHLLIRSEYELCKRRKIPSLTYPTTAIEALRDGPRCLRPCAKISGTVINSFLLIYQLGTCCVYTVFIATNLKSAFDSFLKEDIDVRLYMLVLLLPLIFINWIRNLKSLAPLSTIANGITFASFGVILYFLFRNAPSIEGKSPVGKVADFPLYFGTVLFALEAIGVIMPLENEMNDPKSFAKPAGVLNIGMVSIIVLYIGMGFFGYLTYGDDVQGSITLSLGNEPAAKVVQILLAIAIFFTHALQCYVAIDIFWNGYLLPKMADSGKKTIIWEYVVRTGLVLITFLLAVVIPELELFISLFGALCLSALGIAFPAIIHICAFWETSTPMERGILVAKNMSLVLFGLLGLVVGTYTSLEQIITKFSK